MKNENLIKEEAVKRLQKICEFEDVINAFKSNGEVHFAEYLNKKFPAVLYSVKSADEPARPIRNVIEWFENEYNSLVYFAQLTKTSFGELLSLFFVSDETEMWERENEDLDNGYAFVYVVNDYDLDNGMSEFGSIAFKKAMGTIWRCS